MKSSTAESDPRTKQGATPSASETATVAESAAALCAATRQQLVELLTLFDLEVRYSALMLGATLALAMVTALAGFSIWGLMQAAALAWLLTLGWSWSMALAALAVANAALAGLMLWLMRRVLARVGLCRTRRALGLTPTDEHC